MRARIAAPSVGPTPPASPARTAPGRASRKRQRNGGQKQRSMAASRKARRHPCPAIMAPAAGLGQSPETKVSRNESVAKRKPAPQGGGAGGPHVGRRLLADVEAYFVD